MHAYTYSPQQIKDNTLTVSHINNNGDKILLIDYQRKIFMTLIFLKFLKYLIHTSQLNN